MMNRPGSTYPYDSSMMPFHHLQLPWEQSAHATASNACYSIPYPTFLDCAGAPLLPSFPLGSAPAEMQDYTMVVKSEEERGRIGLNLGQRTYFSSADAFGLDRLFCRAPGIYGPSTMAMQAHVQTPRCQAEGCKVDLSGAKHYHRRHKVCEVHSKSSVVITGGMQQRFCQQCSRFHVLSEFDEAKRSCRKRLADHNRRRRKPQQSTTESSSNTKPKGTANSSKDKSPHRHKNNKHLTCTAKTSATTTADTTSITLRSVCNGGVSLAGHNKEAAAAVRHHGYYYQGLSCSSSYGNGNGNGNGFIHHPNLFCSISSTDASQSTVVGRGSEQQQEGDHQHCSDLLHLGQAAVFELDFM